MEFIKIENGFSILVNGKKIITHTLERPWIYAGKGEATYDMFRGNFKIKDYLIEKVALDDFEVYKNVDGVIVTFSKRGLNSLKVLFTVEDERTVVKFLENPDKLNRLWLRIDAEKEEHIYGCGEQFSDFDLRGKNYPLWTSEQGVGRNKNTYITFKADERGNAGGDYYTTFFPQPTFVSSRKYYCHVDSSVYMDFDFSHEEFHELQIWGVPEKLIFETGETYVKLVGKLTGLLGKQPELPEWVYEGVWLGIQGGTEVVLNKLENALQKGLKVGGIWAQDWEGIRMTSFGKRLMWNWQWNKELYPKLDVKIKELRERGIRFLGYINPYIAVEGDLFKEASKRGYLAKNNNNEDYLVEFGEFYAGVVDFTIPEACEWYKGVIKKEMIDFGLSGWMADFGEYLPTDVILNNGVSAEIMHNAWPAIWAKINREAVEEAGKLQDVTFFMRAGYTGSQKYCTMMWAGDQNVDWSLDDGLASVIPAALSLGMTGWGLHHSDIGGYTTLFEMKRTKELFMRWAEMATFTAIMRTHEGNRPKDNWQFDSDKETLQHFAKMSRIYTTLKPYTKALVKENSETGVPVQRPLFMHYEQDKRAYDIKYEYLYGRDILVAPVYEPGKAVWKVYLPEDEWVHLWTGDVYRGGEIEVDVPLGKPAVFYRKASKYVEVFKALTEI
ncbi:alpha-glucosidase [Clostridium pasteurianum]|uniref:Family 31 glycosyl hydrolase, alpha-glucosidase n=1 Tax=Clostridium pasteurianum BC1 TaxID=86416 RepID=R4K8K0_CLOPA|nr:alpha-glucosidase [Clostridium pasteurianum]AGK95970.1 family 31 glycosyl hydrolase, alpha-glucosidase [Clostridium pasteurianum BC1]